MPTLKFQSGKMPKDENRNNIENSAYEAYHGPRSRMGIRLPPPLMPPNFNYATTSRNRYGPYGKSLDTRGGSSSNGGPLSSISYSEAVKYVSDAQQAGMPCDASAAAAEASADTVTLQICNLDSSIEEANIRHYLLSQLKPITPVLALNMESPSMARVKVPSQNYAKMVVAHLHRKKVGHKRIIVSYLRDPSSAETAALKCQVGGLLKDVPSHSLPVYKFRELFQSRFKTSVSILELYRMPEVCTISVDKNEEKYISLNPEFKHTIKDNPLVDSSQHSVPYCLYHFKQEKSKGWAEQEIEALPNVFMSIAQIQSIIYTLLQTHKIDIPISSLLYCIQSVLGQRLEPNEHGVPLEHLVCCVPHVQITSNVYGIKVLQYKKEDNGGSQYCCDGNDNASLSGMKGSNEPLSQISREVIELIKLNPKCTMKFNRFIPAYHNHFGKQCRVADYGYTRLIELFEALSPVVQVMGDGENRQITLTHRTQVRRFCIDLFKVLRSQPTKSILFSQLPQHFTHALNHRFAVTDYGVCDITDLLDGLVYNNSIVIQPIQNGNDILISIMKRKQTAAEMDKTCIFAGETVELFRNAPQYTILFKRFVRSYHYHFGYQCRLSDYGFTRLAELLEAISGIVRVEACATDEDRKIFLCQNVAVKVFSEQLQELVKEFPRAGTTVRKVNEVLELHKKKYGYQMQPETLGFTSMKEAFINLPYVEVFERNGEAWIICRLDDHKFRLASYAAACLIAETGSDKMLMTSFIAAFARTFYEAPTEEIIYAMSHAISVYVVNETKILSITPVMKLLARIATVLESRSSMTMQQLKNILAIPPGFLFGLGYPNLSSVIQAHHDIFNFSASVVNVHEKSDVSLKSGCIFTKKGYLEYIENCKLHRVYSPPRMSEQKTIQKPQQQTIPPIGKRFYTSNYSNDQMSMSFELDNINNNNNNKNGAGSSSFDSEFGNLDPLYETNNNNTNASGSNNNNNNISRKNELGDIFKLPSFESAWAPPPAYDNLRYEPPKPDTPPSRVLPMYYDPVWTNPPGVDSLFEGQSLNIHLPKLKTVNIISPLCHSYAEDGRMSRMVGRRTSSSFDFDFEMPDANNNLPK